MTRHTRSPERTARRIALALFLACASATLHTKPLDAQAPAVTEDAVTPGVVNVNTATEEELTRLPGVGPSKAQAIIAARARRPFRRARDLLRVSGIGRSTLERLAPMITVEGPTTLAARRR